MILKAVALHLITDFGLASYDEGAAEANDDERALAEAQRRTKITRDRLVNALWPQDSSSSGAG